MQLDKQLGLIFNSAIDVIESEITAGGQQLTIEHLQSFQGHILSQEHWLVW